MTAQHCSLSCDNFKQNISLGLSQLQMNGELVDMTIAAEGYFVKVHQVMMALASPYLKELITSVKCSHPIIFLNNVTHETLCFLLEYIYTGEVVVPNDKVKQFGKLAKDLCILGLKDLVLNREPKPNVIFRPQTNPPNNESLDMGHGIKRITIRKPEGPSNIVIPGPARNVVVSSIKEEIDDDEFMSQNSPDTPDVTNILNIDNTRTAQSDVKLNDSSSISKKTDTDNSRASKLQFTVSIRGSLQVILNRYIYNLHSITSKRGTRKWRCVDYRNHKCMAFLVTKGNIVLSRGNIHNHMFHDKKILEKIKKNAVYSALEEAEAYQETEKSLNNSICLGEQSN